MSLLATQGPARGRTASSLFCRGEQKEDLSTESLSQGHARREETRVQVFFETEDLLVLSTRSNMCPFLGWGVLPWLGNLWALAPEQPSSSRTFPSPFQDLPLSDKWQKIEFHLNSPLLKKKFETSDLEQPKGSFLLCSCHPFHPFNGQIWLTPGLLPGTSQQRFQINFCPCLSQTPRATQFSCGLLLPAY